MKPKVTVGVCVKNAEASIKDAVESILVQDFPHELMEVIFVDDGSDDKTLSILKSYVSKMNMQVKLFHQEWKGLGPARNKVVNHASGDYIVWVDGDMILPEDHIRKQVEFMEQNPDVGIAKARYGILTGANIIAALEDVANIALDSHSKDPTFNKLPGTGGAVFRVEAIRQVGGFDPFIKGVGEDIEVAYRIKKAGWSIRRGTEAIFFERRRESLKELWGHHVWYGYGGHDVFCKNRAVIGFPFMNPIAAFLIGVWYSSRAYKSLRKKFVFLLPFYYSFKRLAWCFGFLKGQMDRYKNGGD
jgi:glycosyltransferase involved in cell wall biosynthesis